IRFHKSIIKEKTVDIIHKMDFVYSLKVTFSYLEIKKRTWRNNVFQVLFHLFSYLFSTLSFAYPL
ncbi:hypothetical protein SJ709_06875, partial [Enterococcus faecium]